MPTGEIIVTIPTFETIEVDLEGDLQDMLVEMFVYQHMLDESIRTFTYDIEHGATVADALYHAVVNDSAIRSLKLAVEQARFDEANPTLPLD
jgi:hypothetical protein